MNLRHELRRELRHELLHELLPVRTPPDWCSFSNTHRGRRLNKYIYIYISNSGKGW